MKITIVGYGRFGKLLSKILAPYGEIFILEKNRKIVDRKETQIKVEELRKMDWVVLSVPISSLESVLENIKPYLKEDSLVMDVSSVKTYPCRWLKKHLPGNVELLGTHPMFGPDSAKNGLKGLKIVTCPVRISQKSLKKVEGVFEKLNLKVIRTTPETHDKEAARSLSLVHFLGRTLGRMKIEKQDITTLGYERLLAVNETVNNDTWQLFFDMHRFNPYAKRIRNRFKVEASKLDKEIDD